jgi:hypothetical protein
MSKYWPIRKCQVTKPSDVKSCLGKFGKCKRTGDSRNRLNTYQGLAKQAENKLPFAATATDSIGRLIGRDCDYWGHQ